MTDLIEFTFTSVGSSLWGGLANPDGTSHGSVVLCHGLTNHHDDAPMFGLLQDKLTQAGYAVFMFDFYGSGRSDGLFHDKTWSIMRTNVADALNVCQQRFGAEAGGMALAGRSVGASLAGYFAKDQRIACSVLASPVLLLTSQFAPYRSEPAADGYVRLPDYVERSGQIKGEWEINETFFDELGPFERDLTEAVADAQRVLVMHGKGDPKVKTLHSEQMMELLGDPKRYLGVEDGDHYYSGHEYEAADATVAWIDTYLGR